MSLFLKRIILLVHLTSVIAIAQKQFSVKIQFPANLDAENTYIYYDNGIEKVIIDVPTQINSKQVNITGLSYAKYVYLSVQYTTRTEDYPNMGFFILGNNAEIKFKFDTKETNKLRVDEMSNIQSIEEAGENKFNSYIADEYNNFENFRQQYRGKKINDSLNAIQSSLRKKYIDKQLDFIRSNANSYYAFSLFRRRMVFLGVSPDTLINLFDTTFSDSLKMSLEGEQVIRYLYGKRLTKNSGAPTFLLKDIKNQPISLEKYRNKFVLLVFWASWCGPCIQEIPVIQKIREQYPESKLEIISLSSDTNENAYLKALKKFNMPWIHAYLTDEVSKKYGINGIPELFLIDKNGILIYKMQEEKDSSLENLTKILVERL
ncbi:MAG: TlpA family protein disulfide reductase [Emticicia sp.]|uniref:TlpA family protein disulfide reductase n=1 Tax=Emticicia sp. TaxID=1930953 RepID=UPI003BA453B5